jgi:hypothetical protein
MIFKKRLASTAERRGLAAAALLGAIAVLIAPMAADEGAVVSGDEIRIEYVLARAGAYV